MEFAMLFGAVFLLIGLGAAVIGIVMTAVQTPAKPNLRFRRKQH